MVQTILIFIGVVLLGLNGLGVKREPLDLVSLGWAFIVAGALL